MGSSATAIKKMQGYKVMGKRLKVEFKKGEHDGSKGDDDFRHLDFDGDGEGSSLGKKSYPDDERLIGYLRAISAKNVVQSLKENEGDARPAENEDSSKDGGMASGGDFGGDIDDMMN